MLAVVAVDKWDWSKLTGCLWEWAVTMRGNCIRLKSTLEESLLKVDSAEMDESFSSDMPDAASRSDDDDAASAR